MCKHPALPRAAVLSRSSALVVLLVAGPVFGFLDAGGKDEKKPLQQYHQSLRGDQARPDWEVIGWETEQSVRFEPAGLRILLPAGNPKVAPETGLRVHQQIKGDFEITVHLGVLQEPSPADTGFGTRVTLGVRTAAGDAATLSRMMHAQGSLRFAAWASAQKEGLDRGKNRIRYFPAEAKAGLLRLRRVGSEITYLASEGDKGEFTPLHQYPFVPDDVEEVQLVATTGGAKAAIDVRLTDLRIRAESLPGLPAEVGTNPGTDAPTAQRRWLAALLLLGLAVAVVVVVAGGYVLVQRRRRGETQPAVPFLCSECGATLKVKSELAGKKVKCSRCNKAVLVPGVRSPL